MNYANIIQYDSANGEGWRTSLFVSGCKCNCTGCFNQEAQDFNYGKPFTMLTMEEVLDMVSDNKISGLSILGGDPLWQDIRGLRHLIELCKRTRYKNKTVWLWSGFTLEQIFSCDNNCNEILEYKLRQELLKNVDVFIDGPYIEEQRDVTLPFRGSKNQRLIDVKETIKQGQIIQYKIN